VTQHTQILFESIESAEEYLLLLSESVREAREALEADTSTTPASGSTKRRDAAHLAAYNLAKLERHFRTSQRILNDLRNLRRLVSRELSRPPISSARERTAPQIPRTCRPA
jgi:hypothetical protein